ncbi:hypothetical protein VTO42DRAFT_8657 [Malbranchea cinnamomea]
MNASDRLNLLFSGEDEELLHIEAVNLQPLPQMPNRSPLQQGSPGPTVPPNSHTLDKLEDPELYEDEYVAISARAQKEQDAAQKRATKWNNAGKGKLPPVTTPNVDYLPAHEFPPSLPNGLGIRYFCPIVAISRYPYKYLRGPDADLIAKQFFGGGKFWARTWDLYYIHPPSDISLQPLVLVPRHQVQALLDEINEAFGLNLSPPTGPGLGVLLPFEDDGTPQPHFLGKSTSRNMKENLVHSIPLRGEDFVPPPGCSPAVNRSFAAFKAKIEAAVEATRRKSKAAKNKRQRDQGLKLRNWCRSLKRLHCYLGLRPRLSRGERMEQVNIGAGMSWDMQNKASHEHAISCGIILLPLDVNQPAPFPFADEPIFICIDVESNEKCHDQITEIGISTLDTLDLVGVPPGPDGTNWMAKIKSRHFRISEYAHVVNSDFLQGCPESFEFGESEWISIKNAGKIVDSCFRPPYSTDSGHNTRQSTPVKAGDVVCAVDAEGERTFVSGREDIQANGPAESIKQPKSRPRNLVLLGHDIVSDIRYLRKLGCKVLNSDANSRSDDKSGNTEQPIFLESLDTSVLFRVLKRETQPSSLAKVLVDLGIVGWSLHNAGNDARYTLQAMIGIALRTRLQDGNEGGAASSSTGDWPIVPSLAKMNIGKENTRNSAWEAEIDRRVAVKVEETEARVREECALWETALGCRGDSDIATDDLDGGAAPGITF